MHMDFIYALLTANWPHTQNKNTNVRNCRLKNKNRSMGQIRAYKAMHKTCMASIPLYHANIIRRLCDLIHVLSICAVPHSFNCGECQAIISE